MKNVLRTWESMKYNRKVIIILGPINRLVMPELLVELIELLGMIVGWINGAMVL